MEGGGQMTGSTTELSPQRMSAPAPQAAMDEQCFQRLVQGITDYAIYMLDLDGKVLSWNAGAVCIHGYQSAEIIGRHFSTFYTEEDRARGLPAEALRIALQAGRYQAEGWRVRRDGSRLWADAVIDLILDGDGRPSGFAKITYDRTEAAQTQRALLESEGRFRYLVQSITDYALYMLDLDGIVTNWNPGAERAKGYKAAEIIGRHFSCFYTAEDQVAGLPAEALRIARQAGRFEAEGWRVRRDGSRIWANVVIDVIRNDEGQVIGFAKITRDITERKADMERLRKVTSTLDIALANMTHGLCVFDAMDGILLANARFREMFGYDQTEDIVGVTFADLVSHIAELGDCAVEMAADDAETACEEHAALIRERLDGISSRAPEQARLISMSCRTMEDGSWVSTFEDITERRRKEAEVARQASQDPLTGLANRRVFTAQLEGLLADERQPGLALLLIDLDGFKSVNDTHGHPAGDAVLLEAARRIRDSARAEDLVARLGGDEFGVISLHADEGLAASIAERIIAAVRRPCALAYGVTARVGASVGIAVAPAMAAELPATAESIIAQADLALYQAKSQGKSTARAFSAGLRENVLARRALEREVRAAVETGEGLGLDYQPVIRLRSGAVTGFEAGLVWQHPGHSDVTPSVFMRIVGHLALMERAGQWMLHRACSDAVAWDDALRVSVKVSAAELRAGVGAGIEQIVTNTNLRPGRLDLEVDGLTAIDETVKLAGLTRLRDLGVQFTLAGIGSSSVSVVHLLSIFPFNRIKIAAVMATEAISNPTLSVMLEMAIEMGHRLGIEVMASGVDTKAHLDLVTRLGCDEATGQMIRVAQPSCAARAFA
jgi:diguanylate cyclase (GGDEF)-like protein/PAS domain S-box-containing protein